MEFLLALFEGSSSFLLTLGIGALCATLFFLKYRHGEGSEQPPELRKSTGQLCEIPSCVRCSNNSKLNQLAHQNFERYTLNGGKDCGRIGDAIRKSLSTKDNSNLTHLFHISTLCSRSVWKLEDLPESYQQDYRILKDNICVFQDDFFKDSTTQPRQTGWSKVFLVNQGAQVPHQHEVTVVVFNKLRNVMSGCIFGYVFYSVLHPGSQIAEHKGPTNCRLRCHVSVQVVEEGEGVCCMLVEGTELKWREGGVVFFDDSLTHSVKYECPSDLLEGANDIHERTGNVHESARNVHCKDRVVLLIDFWHPDLTLVERQCIRECYSSSQ